MSALSLTLLGQFQARLDNQPLTDFKTRKVQALLIYVTAEPEKHLRESLMELMWPGMPDRSARQNLRQVLYYLRSTIPDLYAKYDEDDGLVPFLITNRQMIQLNPNALVQVDVAQFKILLNEVQAHEHMNVMYCPNCLTSLEKAVELYQGDFLIDFYLDDSNAYEEWAQVTREAYRRQTLDALEVLTAAASQQREFPKAETLAKHQLEIDNLRESTYRQLMEILVLSGRREEALAVYENCRRLLAEELGMEPAKWTTEIAEKIKAGDLSFDTSLAQGVRGYELGEEIGVGTYGAVHRAYQSTINREVAVKVIRRQFANDPEFIRRFETEAQTVARLEHPYIVPLYDYWRDPDGAYLVMRYLRGGSLLSALESGPWDVNATGRMLDQLAAALAAAHQQDIIHRDIKPANILLDESGNAYLSDFGIAKNLANEANLTAPGPIVGTLDYISPEQIQSQPASPQTDIYSLGAVLYETLTGEKPFPDSTPPNLIYKHLNESVPLVATSQPNIPKQIDVMIQRATAKDPADRYANVQEMAEAFRQSMGGRNSSITVTMPEVFPTVAEVYNPYKGLRAFQEADADDFFGREALTQQLIDHLADTRFLALVGPSGSGKSSAVKAGLIPALREGAIPGSEKWFVAEMVPGTHPLEELEMALWPIAIDPPPSLVEPMERDNRGLLRTIRRILPNESPSSVGSQLLLIIDQFEELFTQVGDKERRSFFIDSLLRAISAPRSPLRVVITLRADFYDRPLAYETVGRLLKQHTEVVLPLTAEELTWAMREPARRVGVVLEDALAEAIVADVANQAGALPLLQYALTELFERRHEGKITLSAYRDIGGVLGSLSRRAEEIYASLDRAGQESIRQLFLRLVTLGEGVEDTRRRVLRAELESIKTPQSDIDSDSLLEDSAPQFLIPDIINALGAARLLTFDHDPVTRQPTVEVAHEALLREWGRLRGWLDESRSDVRLQRMLAFHAAEWREAGQVPGFLLQDARLNQFAGWAEATNLALTEDEESYLQASIEAWETRLAKEEERRLRELETVQKLVETERARTEEQTQAANRLRQRAMLLAGALVVAALLAVAAFFFAQQSGENAAFAQANANLAVTGEAQAQQEAQFRATAEAEAIAQRDAAHTQTNLATSRELALAALNNLESDPELSILLALQALDVNYTKEAEEALRQGVQSSRVVMALPGHGNDIWDSIYSPDGSTIATIAYSEVTLWEAATGRLLRTIPWTGIDFTASGVEFNERGDEISVITAGDNYENIFVNIWNVNSGELINSIELPAILENWSAALSPDWQLVALGREDGTVDLWDVDSAERVLILSGHDATVDVGLSFSSDGSRLATTSIDGQVQVWDIEASLEAGEGQSIASFTTPQQNATPLGAYFFENGAYLALGFSNADPEVWDLADTSQPKFASLGPGTWDLAIHPENKYLAVADGSTVSVRDLSTGSELFTLSGHIGINSLDFSPDGNHLVTGHGDGMVRIWDVRPYASGELLTFPVVPGVWDIELSPDEKEFALGSELGPATVWDTETGDQLLTLPGESGTAVYRVAYHPDGSRIATVGEDGIVRIWDAKTGDLLLHFIGHTEGAASDKSGILDVEYSPDGSQLATAGADGLAKVWDPETGRELMTLSGHTAGLLSLEYSLDGRYIATSSDIVQSSGPEADASVKIWDADIGQEIYSFGPNPGRAWGLAFSPDGNFLAFSGTAGFISVWDMMTGEKQIDLTYQASTIGVIAFTQDGQRLITGGSGSVSIWDLATGAELVKISSKNGWVIALTRDERRVYGVDFDAAKVGVYAVYLEDVVALAQSRLTRSLTTAECRQYLHADQCPAGVPDSE